MLGEMAFYTGKGDNGKTDILGRADVPKNDPIIEAEGNLDELNSSIGVALYYIHVDRIRSSLKAIQNDLFIIGARLAGIGNDKELPKFDEQPTKRLESEINELASALPAYDKFIIPGGCEGAVHLHLARAIARRAERKVLDLEPRYSVDKNIKSYLNRLSSYLFVAALYLNRLEGVDEEHPRY